MQYHYIYKTTLLCGTLSGKYYIGKRSTDSRRNILPEEDVDYTGSGNVVRRYFKKYGKIPGVTHIKEIIEVNPDKRTNAEREREIIGNLYETDTMCLNIIRGGWGGGWYVPGHTVSEDTRKKLSDSHKGKHPTEETRKLLSEQRKGENHPMYGKHQTEEAKRKVSEGLKKTYENGLVPWNKGKNGEYSLWEGKNPPMLGKHHTEEVRDKISKANTGKKRNEESKQRMSESSTVKKPVFAVNLKTGEETFFISCAKAAEALKIPRVNITKVLKGYEGRKQANGYKFRYA